MCCKRNTVENNPTIVLLISAIFGVTFLLLQDSCRKDYLCVRHGRRQGVGIRDQKGGLITNCRG